MVGIYKITNPEGKVYIGKSNNIEKRFTQYKNFELKQQPALYQSFKKYGWFHHSFEILEECSKDIILEKEKHYINEYSHLSMTLNKKQGGKGIKKITEEDKIRRRKMMEKLWSEGKFKGRKGAKKIIDIKNNKIYNTVTECSKDLNISSTKIYNDIKKGKFKYIEQQVGGATLFLYIQTLKIKVEKWKNS